MIETLGRSISRGISLRLLNDMADDPAVRKTIKAIPRSQRYRRLRKFVSLARQRGVREDVLADFMTAMK